MNRNVIYALIAVVTALAVWMLSSSSNKGGGEVMVDVKIPELSLAAMVGKTAFNDNCSVCHGENGAGKNGAGPPLIHKIYEPGHHGDQAFLLAAKTGVRSHHWKFGNMPPVENISESDIRKIVTYIREIQRANGIL